MFSVLLLVPVNWRYLLSGPAFHLEFHIALIDFHWPICLSLSVLPGLIPFLTNISLVKSFSHVYLASVSLLGLIT